MVQIIQQTKEEKIEMYMKKCTKKQLADMLYACNLMLSFYREEKTYEEDSNTTLTFTQEE